MTLRVPHRRSPLLCSGGTSGRLFRTTPGHWIIDSVIANPMSGYPEYKERRSSWGSKANGTVIVESVTESGLVGIGLSQGGIPASRIIIDHLSRFLLGSDPRDTERLWDQMFRATLPYGRKGLPICAISAVDIALWDLCGKATRRAGLQTARRRNQKRNPLLCHRSATLAAKELGSSAAKCHCPTDQPTATKG